MQSQPNAHVLHKMTPRLLALIGMFLANCAKYILFTDLPVIFRLSYPVTCHEGAESRGTALLLFNLGVVWEWTIFALPRSCDSGERATVNIVQEAGWTPGPPDGYEEGKNSFPKPEFESQDLQSVADHYTPTISWSAIMRYSSVAK